MRMSEGCEVLCLQRGGHDSSLSLPCFLLGVVDSSEFTSSATSTESEATALPRPFITRSYLLFHSRLTRASQWQQKDMSEASPQEASFHFYIFIHSLTWCMNSPALALTYLYDRIVRMVFLSVFHANLNTELTQKLPHWANNHSSLEL